jgi:hypothetical protein
MTSIFEDGMPADQVLLERLRQSNDPDRFAMQKSFQLFQVSDSKLGRIAPTVVIDSGQRSRNSKMKDAA